MVSSRIKTKDLTTNSIGAQSSGISGTIKVQAPTPKEQLKTLNSKRKDLKNQIKQLDKEERQIKKTLSKNSSKKTTIKK